MEETKNMHDYLLIFYLLKNNMDYTKKGQKEKKITQRTNRLKR